MASKPAEPEIVLTHISGGAQRHLHQEEHVPILVRAEMPLEVLPAPAHFLEHEDAVFLQILVDVAADTAGIHLIRSAIGERIPNASRSRSAGNAIRTVE
jgi:hypothetical protein